MFISGLLLSIIGLLHYPFFLNAFCDLLLCLCLCFPHLYFIDVDTYDGYGNVEDYYDYGYGNIEEYDYGYNGNIEEYDNSACNNLVLVGDEVDSDGDGVPDVCEDNDNDGECWSFVSLFYIFIQA